MQDINIAGVSKNVMSLFGKTVVKLAKTIKFVKRKSKLGAKLFVETLVFGCLSDPSISLEKICRLIKERGVKITKQGLQQRFNAEAAELMQKFLLEAMEQFKIKNDNVFKLLQPFSAISILDSSGIALPSHLKNIYKSTGGAGSAAGIKIQLMLDYTNGQIKQVEILEGRKNDQSYVEYLEQIEKGSLHLQDLGYFKILSLIKIQEKGGYFISRFFTTTKVFDENSALINLVEEFEKSEAIFEKQVLLGQKEKMKVRLVGYRLSDQDAEKHVRKVKENARKQGNTSSKTTLELCRWSIYITNIPLNMLSTQYIHLVYTLRWQIELFFKLGKSAAGIAKVSGRKINRILCEIYAKLACIVMLLYFCFPLRWRDIGELSFIKAYGELALQASNFFKALGSLYQLKNFMGAFFSNLEDFAYKDRHRKKES